MENSEGLIHLVWLIESAEEAISFQINHRGLITHRDVMTLQYQKLTIVTPWPYSIKSFRIESFWKCNKWKMYETFK